MKTEEIKNKIMRSVQMVPNQINGGEVVNVTGGRVGRFPWEYSLAIDHNHST